MPAKQLIHLSDLHIGKSDNESSLANLVVRHISASYPGVPVIITGDLTNSATKNQFIALRVILDRLAKTNPVLAVPGNHDYKYIGLTLNPQGWQNWVTYCGSPLGWSRPSTPAYWTGPSQNNGNVEGIGIWEDGPITYIGVDSGSPHNKQLAARGLISPQLANALLNVLQKHSGKTRVVFLHHHPFTRGVFTALSGSSRLMAALRSHCELLLFGHHHKYGIWWDTDNIPLIVASHKTTEPISGRCCAFTVIDITNAGTNSVSFAQKLDMIMP